jgi:hypothetical protein
MVDKVIFTLSTIYFGPPSFIVTFPYQTSFKTISRQATQPGENANGSKKFMIGQETG